MQQVDFTEAEIKHGTFNTCDLKNSTFDRTNIEHADFTSAYNFNINPNFNQIKHASFSKENISGLLSSFHIKIKN
ncbi:pentapeptide repeat protein [Winogradskyella sediminis]|nr:pentapeptide repeat protein [Winogradskyella sediminis]